MSLKPINQTEDRRKCGLCGIGLYQKYTTTINKMTYMDGACLTDKVRVCSICADKHYSFGE